MLEIVNPATAKPIKKISQDNAESVEAHFQASRKALLSWKKTSFEHRISVIETFWQLLSSQAQSCATITSEETGRPMKQVLAEIVASEKRIRFFIEHFKQVIATHTAYKDEQVEERISWEPLGVIANISAWNYPYFVGFNVIIPALLTGNTLLYKPSEFASLTGLKIAELFAQSGLTPGVFTSIIGDGEVGKLILEKEVDAAFFTGSYLTGRKINELLAPRLIRVGLELGGKDPCYITEGVDIEAVAEAVADGAFYNCGQSCCALERIYVHEDIYEKFLECFTKVVSSFKVGSPLDQNTYIGPLTRKAQIAVLEEQIQDAIAKGARLLLGGKAVKGDGFYFEPTVISETNHSMKLMREESFGPLIGIQKVSGDEQAIELMNDTDYGLTASVYSQDLRRAEAIMSELNAGTVYANCCDRVSPFTPWSGRKGSGLGSTLGELGIQSFVQPKAWHIK